MTDEELGGKLWAAYVGSPQNRSGQLSAMGARARELLAAEAPELPPICGMTVEQFHEAFKAIYAGNNGFRQMDHALACAIIAHRLAQPTPKIDPDAEAKRLAWMYYISSTPIERMSCKTPDELWKMVKLYHANWRAVAAAKVGEK